MDGTSSAWEKATVALDVPVRFAETDLMGVVHHSVYIVWFEAGRVEWMERAGMPYPEVAASGHHLAVTRVTAEYRTSARFGETVRVTTRVSKLRSRQVAFAYSVTNAENGAVLATGESEHICVDLDGRMAKIPGFVTARLAAGAERIGRMNDDPP